jgi:hypothetical protein
MIKDANETALSPSSNATTLYIAAKASAAGISAKTLQQMPKKMPDKSANIKNVTPALHSHRLHGFPLQCGAREPTVLLLRKSCIGAGYDFDVH